MLFCLLLESDIQVLYKIVKIYLYTRYNFFLMAICEEKQAKTNIPHLQHHVAR